MAPPVLSGPRPLHLSRRGPVYVIRLTFPRDLRDTTGVIDIRRSLQTKTIDVARRRCLDAEQWFNGLVLHLRSMGNPTRDDIEVAAASYFALLQADVDRPRMWPDDNFEATLALNVEETRRRIEELEDQLRTNVFDGLVDENARQMLVPFSTSLDALSGQLAMFARQLAAKAERQQMRYFDHVLQTPAAPFRVDDALFGGSAGWSSIPAAGQVRGIAASTGLANMSEPDGMTLRSLIGDHKAWMIDQALSESHVIEFERVARWAEIELGENTPITSISTNALRSFRDKLRTIDKTVRSRVRNGVKSLDASLTTDREKQIRSETARRYWAYAKALFARAVSEGFLDQDPAASLVVSVRKDEARSSPEPYSTEELKRFFAMPVFTGRRSQARQKDPGNCHIRDGYFWSVLLQAYSGMRGGEVSQLLPEDCVFDADVPHILVRKENEQGDRVKSIKNKASARAVPIANDLLILGLQQFVSGRKARRPHQRLLHEFPTGTGGKQSDGLSKFWRRYISAFGLHKPGRALHVWRHTVTIHLRRNGVSDEDIGYLIGHRLQSETARYGVGELLERVRSQSLERLDFGFDLVGLVGGPFNVKIHAE